MPQESDAADRYLDRAGDFIRSASVLCGKLHDGWLPSANLLLGFGCELLAKRRLLHARVTERDLRYPPYGHDISAMWRDKTELFEEAKFVVSELKQNPNPDGVDVSFDWDLHFDHLARAHSQEGDYSLRYHHGEIHFSDPRAMTLVVAKIWRDEHEKSLNRTA